MLNHIQYRFSEMFVENEEQLRPSVRWTPSQWWCKIQLPVASSTKWRIEYTHTHTHKHTNKHTHVHTHTKKTKTRTAMRLCPQLRLNTHTHPCTCTHTYKKIRKNRKQGESWEQVVSSVEIHSLADSLACPLMQAFLHHLVVIEIPKIISTLR